MRWLKAGLVLAFGVVLLAAITGCEEAKEGALPSLKTGDKWTYTDVNEGVEYTVTMEITGEGNFNGVDCYVCDVSYTPALYGIADAMMIKIDKTNVWPVRMQMTGVAQELPFLATTVSTAEFPEASPWPFEVGKEFKLIETLTTTTTVMGETKTETKTKTSRYKVEKTEDITVPAGTFKCFEIVRYDEDGNKLETSWHSDKVKNDVKTLDHKTGDTSELKFYQPGVASTSASKAAPAAAFSAAPTSGTAALTVQFMDQSRGKINNYAWDFDNNGTVDSTAQDPSYKYNEPGDYTVSLTITGPDGSDTEVKTQHIQVSTSYPAADFTAILADRDIPLEYLFNDPSTGEFASWNWDTGNVPFTVVFSDLSTGAITRWEWDFNNDGIVDSTVQNPVITYSIPGKYTVSLKVTGPGGSDTEVKASYIQATPEGPLADFTAAPVSGGAPLTVQFTNKSEGEITSWQWDFDNNGTVDSTVQNPAYTYNTPGEYAVSLKVTGPGGTSTDVKAKYIHASIFPDSGLEAAIRKAISKPTGTILVSDLEALTSLTAKNWNISNLKGLEYCINLTNLDLFSNHLVDVSPLANLTKLTKLNLGSNDNAISIAPLANLINLTELSFTDSWGTVGAVRDLSPIANLSGLTKLSLTNCFIRDLSALANLTNLTYLELGRNSCTGNDLIPLVNLVNLRELGLYNTPYGGTLDIAPLVNNPGLSSGDTLWLGNSLTSNTLNIYIPQLQARGVDVRY